MVPHSVKHKTHREQRVTLRSIFWPGGGNGGRAPLGCPLTFSFSILSLTYIQHKACRLGAFTPINRRKFVCGRSCCHFAFGRTGTSRPDSSASWMYRHALKPLCLAPCQPGCRLRQVQSSWLCRELLPATLLDRGSCYIAGQTSPVFPLQRNSASTVHNALNQLQQVKRKERVYALGDGRQAWWYLLEAGHQECLHIAALQQDLLSQAPYVLQLLCFQPAAATLNHVKTA